MYFQLIVAGASVGLVMSAPLGPVNLIVIRTAMNHDWKAAFLAGLGAVLSDLVMAGVAAYGIHSITHFFSDYAKPMQVAGGLMLVILGIRIARTHYSASDFTPLPHAARFGLTFGLAVTNPALILGFLAIFSSMSGLLALGESPYRPLAVLLGVAIGGALWWATLSFIVSQARARLGPAALDRINRWSGVLVAAFGFTLLLKMIY